MKYENVRGIVVKCFDYLESDKLLTLLTFEKGLLTIKAKGVRKNGSKLAYGARQFFCGDFECVESHGKLIMTGVARVHDFSDIAADLDKYYAACHFAEIALAVIMEEHPDEEMLRMFLNTLHMLTKESINLKLLISMYEMRAAAISGFAPVMDECVVCGSDKSEMRFSFDHGGLVCCAPGAEIDEYIKSFIETLSQCEMKKMFSLTVPESSLIKLGKLSRRYIETVLDKKFTALDSISEG